VLKQLRTKFYNTSLRQKLVVMISVLVTILPTILLATLAYTYYSLGIESLFNDKISQALSHSVEIAESYLKEHKDNIKTDILEIANDLSRNEKALDEDPSLYKLFVNKQAYLRNLSEIMIFQRDRVIAQNSFSLSLSFERLPEKQLLEAESGEVIILDQTSDDKVRALLKMHGSVDTFLLIGRLVDKDILNHLKMSQGSASLYSSLMADISNTKLRLELIFVSVSILLCIIAILIGMRFARYITKPLNLLVNATAQVKSGDFTVRLPEKAGIDETAILTRAFNQMTETLSIQHNQLSTFTKLIDERRRFIEAVLAEVTAGVMVISQKGIITLFNNSAAKLLDISRSTKALNYKKVFKEIAELIKQSQEKPTEIIQQNIEFTRKEKKLTFFVRVGTQLTSDSKIESFIVTFDDISDLVIAQRSAAWADVARRIAHEIKNPLTPIHLSAERIKKKYLNEITSDKESFEKYVDTIIRHVEDIGKIVEEFVDFARIPQPKIATYDISKFIKDALFSQGFVYKFNKYVFDYNEKPCYVLCDPTQISQVLTNLLKNAAESIEAKRALDSKNFAGKIKVSLHPLNDKFVEIKIEDNGMGFDKSILDRVTEPYVTTKTKGTGLGLPIVKKIIEDHGGTLSVSNSSNGAVITFNLLIGESHT
jgi:two-component system nitrogen regulation sensor histidine kinase NtrY